MKTTGNSDDSTPESSPPAAPASHSNHGPPEIGPFALLLRVLVVIAASETAEILLETLLDVDDWLGDILFDAIVMSAVAVPMVYFMALRPLVRRFAAHAALERTSLEQDLALKASQERLALSEYAETVVASVPSGLVVLTTDLSVLSVNQALREMFAVTDAEIVGRPLERILPGASPWKLVAEVLGSDQPSPTTSVDVPDVNGVRHFYVRLTRLRQGANLRLLMVIEDITKRTRLQKQIEDARARFWGILDAASDAIISVDETHRILVFNQQAEHIFGYTAAEAIGQHLTLLMPSRFHGSHDDHVKRFAGEAVSRRPMGERPVLTARRKDGGEFPVEVTISKLVIDGRTVLTAIVRDVTAREQAEQALRESQEALQDFLDTASDLVQTSSQDGRLTYVNRAWLETLGYQRDELADLAVSDLVHPDGREGWRSALERVARGESLRNLEVVFVRKNGRTVTLEGSMDARAKDGAVAVRAIFRDITERKVAAERLRTLAYYDTLTGLPNRVLFQDRLAHMLAQARRERGAVGLLYLDIDRFKVINDSLGHTAGDQLLQTVAQRLTGAVRASNTVCRLGGDEFTVILGMTTPQGTAVVARNILRSIAQPMMIQEQEVSVTSSIGIAMFPTDSDDIQTLLKNADTAMYRAKARGNFYQFFEASMHAQALDRFALEGQLRRALERQEFEVFYQPQVDLTSGRLTGLEALVRWRRPDGQIVLAGEFIALAEETGLLVLIGEWVLNTACTQVRAWRDQGLRPPRVAVNLSSRQLMRSNLPDVVRRALDRTDLAPQDLELELTEQIFTQDPEHTTAGLDRLRDMGVGLAIDEFGTGYSALSVFKRFNIGTVKIGHALVRDVTENADAAAIVTASIAMAHHLGVQVIAEGVERQAQVEWLSARGADVIQGEVVALPMPADAVLTYLSETWRFGLSQAA